VGDEIADNVAWSYEHPPEEVKSLAGLIAFYANRVRLVEGD